MFSQQPTAPRKLMNQLVGACKDDQVVLAATAAVLHGYEKNRMLGRVQRRGEFLRELAALGGAPAARGSMMPHMRVLFQRMRGALEGAHEGDAYRACAHTEAHTESVYAAALREPLPDSVRQTLERQLAEVHFDHVELRLQQWGRTRHWTPAPWPVAEKRATPPGERENSQVASRWEDDGGGQSPAAKESLS